MKLVYSLLSLLAPIIPHGSLARPKMNLGSVRGSSRDRSSDSAHYSDHAVECGKEKAGKEKSGKGKGDGHDCEDNDYYPPVPKTFSIRGRALEEGTAVCIPNTTIELHDAISKNIIATTLTDVNGKYRFKGIPIGKYEIWQLPIPGYRSVRDADGGNPDKITVKLRYTSSSRNNFYDEKVHKVRGCILTPSLQGSPLLGHTASILLVGPITAMINTVDGTYEFPNVPAGSYTITLMTMQGFDIVDDTDPGSLPGVILATITGTSNGNDFAVQEHDTTDDEPDLAFIAGRVLLEDIRRGTPYTLGAVVELTLPDDTRRRTTTDNGGNYVFLDLPIGTYTVTLQPIDGFDIIADSQGMPVGNIFLTLTISGSTENNFAVEPILADIAGTVHLENIISGSLFQDGAEIEVTLPDLTTKTATSDARGNYVFMGLPLGMYTVTLQPIDGYEVIADSQPPMDGVISVMLTDAGSIENDFAIQHINAVIGGTVHLDTIETGRPIPGVDVVLTLPDNCARTTKTDHNGEYVFIDLPPGMYTVTLQPIDGYEVIADSQPPMDGVISVMLTDAGSRDNDFAIQHIVAFIGGTVHLDAIGTGRPIPGAEIVLALPDNSARTTKTDHNGVYVFIDLPPGMYTVTLQPIDGHRIIEDSDPVISRAIGVISVPLTAYGSSENDFAIAEVLCKISGSVLVFDEFGPPISGSEVELFFDGNLVKSVLTPENGFYSFKGLSAGTYTIRQTNAPGPPTYIDVGDIDGGDPNEIIVEITSADSTGNNFYDQTELKISGTVLVFDEYGPPISGSEVELFFEGNIIDSVLTPENGFYSFKGLSAGTYTIRQTNAPGAPTYIDVGDIDGGDPNEIIVELASADSNGNNFYDQPGCKILEDVERYAPMTLPDCFEADSSASPDLPFFETWQWLTEVSDKKMGLYDPVRPVVLGGIYERAQKPQLRNNIRVTPTATGRAQLTKVEFWSNAAPGPGSTKDMDIRNEGNAPHVEQSVSNGQVDVFGTRYTADADCCSSNNTVGEYYVYGVADFVDSASGTEKQCAVRICYELVL